MKTTVKTQFGGSAIVQPLKLQGLIMITARDNTGETVFLEISPDEAGVILFGMEQALRAIGCEVPQ